MLKPTAYRVGMVTMLSALLLPPIQLAEARKAGLATPCYDKLVTGAGPSTNDPALITKSDAGKTKIASASIAPISLIDTGASPTEDSTNPDTSTPLLKSTISTTDYIPKGPLDPSTKSILIPSESIAQISGRRKKGEITIKQAAMVNVMPIALMQSDDETKEKVETILDAEKKQLADLWEATLTRSQDIQFVVQKLMPTSNAPHAATILSRTLSMCLFGGVGAVGAMSPNMGTLYASQMGASMIMSVLGQVEGKAEKRAKISESESVMLYNMVRNTADKMVENYRDYTKSLTSVARATEDLVALQNMAGEAIATQDAGRQLEMQYTLKKAQRDIEEKSADLRKYRQALQDLAGSEALAKLDKQIQDENTRVADETQTAGTVIADPVPATPAAASGDVAHVKDDADSSKTQRAGDTKTDDSKPQTASAPDNQS